MNDQQKNRELIISMLELTSQRLQGIQTELERMNDTIETMTFDRSDLKTIKKRKYPCPECETGELYDDGSMFMANFVCDNPKCDYEQSENDCFTT